jgi:hypothetical protein
MDKSPAAEYTRWFYKQKRAAHAKQEAYVKSLEQAVLDMAKIKCCPGGAKLAQEKLDQCLKLK